MKLNTYLKQLETYVINVRDRQDKRAYIESHLKSHKLSYQMHIVSKHSNPKRGCLESHLAILRKAIANHATYVWIIEDDCAFIRSLDITSTLPSSWDMLYLGGTVHRILDRKIKGYARVQCWTTHSYIVHLKNKTFVDALLEMEQYDGEVDRFYLENIHPRFHAYMCDPMIALQKDGFSDIENREVSYDFMQYTLQGLTLPESSIDEAGNYVLKLPSIPDTDYPYVTIITPTYRRRNVFSMALRNFEHFIYPKEKLEWIIVDDSPCTEYIDETVQDLLPRRDKRIKFSHIERESPMTIAMKRNIAVSNASYSYIVHMDDDDYYPPESIMARIKILIKYKPDGIQCVGSTLIGTYNILTNQSSMSSDGPISLSEASMAYTRAFWEEHPFDESCIRGEHKSFTEQRFHKIMDIPYSFIIIAINHKHNFTEQLRSDSTGILKFSEISGKEGQIANFFDTWDLDTQLFIIDLRNYLLKH